jgi:hypothetical protein
LLTIYVPVKIFMAQYVMVLRGATSFRGALKGVGPENIETLLGFEGCNIISRGIERGGP